VKKLNEAAVQTIKSCSVRHRLREFGAQILTDDPATPRISCAVYEERNRKMGGLDQGQRRDH